MRDKQFRGRQTNTFFVAIISLLSGLLAGALLMASIGSNPLLGYKYLVQGALMNSFQVGNTLATATNLLLVGLSVAIAFKAGLYNFGASGQMLVGGMTASLIALRTTALPHPLALAILILSALLGGALWGIIPGLLKGLLNVHEVLSTMLMNWIAYWSVCYFAPALLFESDLGIAHLLRLSWLSKLFNGSSLDLVLFVAIAALIIIKFTLDKTTFGFELKAVGSARDCAEYAGIKVKAYMVLSMMMAGGLAGLAGLAFHSLPMQAGFLPSQGFDGIAVAVLAAGNPLGVVFSSLFFGLLKSGKAFMCTKTGIPAEIADIIIALIIYFSACTLLFKKLCRGNKVKITKSADDRNKEV